METKWPYWPELREQAYIAKKKDLEKAIYGALKQIVQGPNKQDCENIAEHICRIFGYETYVPDMVLRQEDRQFLNELEDLTDIVKGGRHYVTFKASCVRKDKKTGEKIRETSPEWTTYYFYLNSNKIKEYINTSSTEIGTRNIITSDEKYKITYKGVSDAQWFANQKVLK